MTGCVAQANGPAYLHSSTATADILTISATAPAYQQNVLVLETDGTASPANVLQFVAGSTPLLDVSCYDLFVPMRSVLP